MLHFSGLKRHEFSRPRKGEIVCVLIFPHIGLIDLRLMACLTCFFRGERRPVRGDKLSVIPPLVAVAAAATMEAAAAGMFVMFERTPLTGFIAPPNRAKRAVAANAAGLAAGGWATVSSPLRALTT